MAYFERLVYLLSRWCNRVAQVALVAMMLMLGSNIILRFIGKPILGVYDWTGLIGTILIALSLAYCGIQRGHIRVEFIVTFFPQRVQAAIDSIMGIVSLVFFILAAWQSVVLGNEMWQKGDVSMTVQTPFHPFVYIIAFGCLSLCLVILADTIKSLAKVIKG